MKIRNIIDFLITLRTCASERVFENKPVQSKRNVPEAVLAPDVEKESILGLLA